MDLTIYSAILNTWTKMNGLPWFYDAVRRWPGPLRQLWPGRRRGVARPKSTPLADGQSLKPAGAKAEGRALKGNTVESARTIPLN